MLNKWIGIGRLTRDPELKYTQTSKPYTNITLAVQRSYENNNGKYDADFIPVTIWGKQAESTCAYLKKGNLVAIEGNIQSGNYEKDGEKHYTMKVIANRIQFLDSKKKETSNDDANLDTGFDDFIPADIDGDLPF